MNYLYLMVVSLYALFIGFKFIKPQISEIWFRTFIIFLGLSIIFFFHIDLFTVSGNGNLGIAVLVFLIPIFLFWLGIFSKRVIKDFNRNPLQPLKNIYLTVLYCL
ncbi:hypothetical protein I6J18_02745 [Peribacillus psychrosaccharolyticus]|uniref:Uncharacterized protein n=1 Tax=Peribacillus psychrosaccharolyticus TaxID=1407 RepID=A0A974NN94_PERPY|nr:hypothetical protein [Peribacillus psychrosaccharolyticus]MEC2055927.1 hypothetical protein [Peribacillus psychrosaccharolyticus]MED3743102.1 hypothetical protein [Peribacillus psychrosaccharolyticus]QQT00856.1 hypothetical protein I6J18_02745 [Peribacillus psychrosaccharolyticus]